MQKATKWVTLLIAVAAFAVGLFSLVKTRGILKIGFVDTQILIKGFKPAYEVQKELDADEKAFTEKFKILEDSMKTIMDTMSVKYNSQTPKEKRDSQDYLASFNQRMNNIAAAHRRSSESMRAQKMQKVYDMINTYMDEFGRKEGYSIIFGTVQGGSILYGENTPADITRQVMDGLNKKFP